MRWSHRSRLAGIATALAALGCGDDMRGRTAADVTIRDSSGVRIVETSNTLAKQSAWTIDPIPVRRVGWAGGDPEFQSVTYGTLRPDGSAVVADGGSGRLFVIPDDGGPVRAFGGRGDGPGEFNDFAGVVAVGTDSLVVADARNNRATVLDDRGGVLGDLPFQPLRGSARYGIAGRVDGQYALVPTMLGSNANEPPGWKRYPVFLSPDLSALEPVLDLPLLYEPPDASDNPVRQAGRVEAGPNGWLHARSDVAELAWYAPDGTLTQIARWDAEVRDVDVRDWEDVEAYARATMRLPPERLDELLGRWREDFSGTLPLFGLLRVDDAGNAWLGDSGLFVRWEDQVEIVSADGVYLGHVRFPVDVWVLDLSDTRALVVERDDLDVQAVAIYEIRKP